MSLETLYDLYIDQLKDLYSAENQLVDALPEMAAAATDAELQQAFEDHAQRTRSHVEEVRAILDELDVDPGNKVCVGMEGLIKESREVIEKEASAAAKDAALILAAQKVEHYEIASYGGLRTYAELLDYGDFESTLADILDEEGQADKRLTELAEGRVFEKGLNVKAQE